jgi:hypothetical protein
MPSIADDHTAEPDDLSKWGLHCFCLGARSTPHRIVAMDDNGRILYHARHGINRTEMSARGIAPLDSQIALLSRYGLLTEKDDRFVTSFPVLGSAETGALRPRLRELADALVPSIASDVSTIGSYLSSQRLAHCAYAVIFGYVIDGLLWELLKAAGVLPATELSVERPYWNGAFWTIHPPRAGVAGTNEVSGKKATLTMVWTRPTLGALNALAGSRSLRSALDAIAGGGTFGEPIVAEDGVEWRFTDDSGEPVIPVIRRRTGDPIHDHGLRIAEPVASMLCDDLVDQFVGSIGGANREATLLVVAHELIWDLMDALQAAGILGRPRVLDDPRATPQALSAQIFVRIDEEWAPDTPTGGRACLSHD